MINLFSDTQTLPTDAMFAAAARAPLGDDMMEQDPTANRLQEMAAARLGMEAALFVPSGVMGNLIGLMCHGGHGQAAILTENAHIYVYEAGSFCSIAGYLPLLVPAPMGVPTEAHIMAQLRPENVHFARRRVLALENTHNLAGGTVMSPAQHRALCDLAHKHGLKVHLDGARIFNAAVARRVDAKELVRGADTVMFCLSKGLSCPGGSLLCGPKDTIAEARRIRKRLGGAMRQVGVLAAMGIVALEQMVDRLAEDHANARRLAEGMAEMRGLKVDLARVQTNMVYADIGELGVNADAFLAALREGGVSASPMGPTRVRFVTHRHISAKDIDGVLTALRKTCAALPRK